MDYLCSYADSPCNPMQMPDLSSVSRFLWEAGFKKHCRFHLIHRDSASTSAAVVLTDIVGSTQLNHTCLIAGIVIVFTFHDYRGRQAHRELQRHVHERQ
mmetsp:Transcript_29323/g.65071  ORF Transcript_29323/g.65071 Transcript_29323/m.65071 type:complete len:99 (+) Transcript_29323:82-378(+)